MRDIRRDSRGRFISRADADYFDSIGYIPESSGGPRIGSLFSGYGGLEMGVQQVLGGSTAWHVDFDEAPSRVLAHRWPHVPNYGDIRSVDWAAVEPVEVLTGGFPCQDVSLAGRRAGITAGTRSGLWSEFARAIDVLRPGLVVIENVRGLLSAAADGALEPDPWGVGDGATRPVVNALGVVLGDLAGLGYDTVRCGVRAADAGAPHERFRIFILAVPAPDADGRRTGRWTPAPRHRSGEEINASLDGADARSHRAPATHASSDEPERWGRQGVMARSPGTGEVDREERQRDGHAALDSGPATAWGDYEPAIRNWEAVIRRPAPAPTIPDGKKGAHRLSAEFVEWMMGLPQGHVTASEIGLKRAEQFKALGNGVVPQQAALALQILLPLARKVGAA